MNQEIKPRHVNSEQAKLLKEKGFDIECRMCIEEGDERPLPFNCGNTIHKNSLHPYYSAPEQWQVVEWLRVKHGVWIFSDYGKKTKNWYYNIQFLPTQTTHIERILWQDGFETPQEAYSAAFDYILNNDLI
jgi:hypothetical protein